MLRNKTALALFVVMLLAAFSALALTPSKQFSQVATKMDLDEMIPSSFGDWQQLNVPTSQIVDPRQAAMLDQIYAQMLSRTYINQSGYRIMLSIAYGEDQRDATQLHYPEVCYPAQGFKLADRRTGTLDTTSGSISVTRLLTSLGKRKEPVTYWTIVGEQVVQGKIDKKLTEMQYGLMDYIPDGLLFRVSSIDGNSTRAFEQQRQFVDDFLTALSPANRLRLAGLGD